VLRGYVTPLQMLRLPPLLQLQLRKPPADQDGVAAEKDKGSDELNVLRLCMHLTGEVHSRLEDFETIRRQKALKIREAARLRGEENLEDPMVLPEVKAHNPSHIKKIKNTMRVGTGATQRTSHIIRLMPEFCKTGGDEAPSSPTRQNISHTGSWLDRRAFSTINDHHVVQGRNGGGISVAKGDISEGDRFFLRRCKDVLKKRHHTLQQAWQKLTHVRVSEPVSLTEFVASTTALFKAYEARLLYRLLDVKSDGNVTFREMQSMLEGS